MVQLGGKNGLPAPKGRNSLHETQKNGTGMMGEKPLPQTLPDQSLLDTTPCGSGTDDSVSDASENAAVTRHSATINGATIAYTARAGHLVTTDQ
jgi:carboxypeptidase C (cathepsin A)